MYKNQFDKKYHLSSEEEEKRRILEIIAHPGRFLFLARLMQGENAMTTAEAARILEIPQQAFFARILRPLVEAHIIEGSKSGIVGGRGKEYYISPSAPDYVQRLLMALFEQALVEEISD